MPLIIVVGTNDLALRVCEELCATRGHEVVVVWDDAGGAAARIERTGARFAALPPNDYGSLESIGIREASCIMPVCEDDRLNLQIALKARDLNREIRIVLRQFNRALGRKIEQNLPNCTAISPAAHAAATYAGAAVDPSCLYALQFPAVDGPLIGFSERKAQDFGLDDCSTAEAERQTGLRIAAINGRIAPRSDDSIRREDRVVACGRMRALQESWPRRRERPARPAMRPTRSSLRDLLRSAARLEPLLIYTFAAGIVLYFASTVYFAYTLRLTFVEAMYFVAATMFTVGYGDITPYTRHAGELAYIVAIAIMGVGVTLGGVFIATIAAALNRAQETALRGLRHVHADDHVIVCGAGNVGTRVIDFLLQMEQRVVVIEPRPNALVLEHARARRIDLLASDATSDDTLVFCALDQAQSLVAITDSDTANLEAALGALVHNPSLSIVMRILDPEFSRSITRNFRIARSFSASDLTAPAIAGLARFPASRGRVRFADETFNVGERDSSMHIPRAEGGIPLFLWRDGNLRPMHDFAELREGDRLLDLVPLSQFLRSASDL